MSVLDYFGVDWVCDQILNGRTLTAIAREATVARSTLLGWIAADTDRSARVRVARQQAGAAWDDMAEEGLAAAKTSHELAVARELAHHWRWRASKIDPNYKDRVVQEHVSPDGSMTPQQIISTADPMEAAKLYAEMMGKG